MRQSEADNQEDAGSQRQQGRSFGPHDAAALGPRVKPFRALIWLSAEGFSRGRCK